MRNKIALYIVVGLMILGATLRSYKLHEPLGDWHSWRQVDTASVAREYVKKGQIDLLHPQYHDLGSSASGFDNPNGWRFVEFPLRDALHATLVMWAPQVGLVEWGRIISIVSSTLTIGLIYLIGKHISGRRVGIFSALIFAILPYNMFYGRVVLPEPMLVLFMMSALYSFLLFWDKPSFLRYLLTLTSLTLSILFKPTALVVLFPMVGYALPTFYKQIKASLASLLLPIFAIVPYLLWRRYISSFPEGIPGSDWLFNSNHIRFKGAWFRWLFGERIAKMILGYFGVIPLGFGLVRLGESLRPTLVYGGLLLGSLTYLSVIATGNVQHDYYQIQIMPTVALLCGYGLDYMFRLGKGLRTLWVSILAIALLLLSVALSWYEIQGFFWVNNRAMVKAGQTVDRLVPEDAKVIAPYMNDTAFLFQTNRLGWAHGGAIDKKILEGASYYVTTTKDDEYKQLITKYEIVEENDEFAIIKLK